MNKEFEDILQPLHWINPDTIESFKWQHGWVLNLIYIIPVFFIIRKLMNFFYFKTLKNNHAQTHVIASGFNYFLHLISYVPITLTLVFLIVAMARPTIENKDITETHKGINILFALDISESMLIEDLKPNRLERAKKFMSQFILKRTSDQIGILLFSGEPITHSPLTNDQSFLSEKIKSIKYNSKFPKGTAIGSVLGAAINRLKNTSEGQRVLILISDGENTSGLLDPLSLADLCSEYDIKIVTIGLGKNGLFTYVDQNKNEQFVESKIDEKLLKTIAEKTDGLYFRIEQESQLQQLHATLDHYEKGSIESFTFTDTKDYYHVYLVYSIFFFLISIWIKPTFINNLLEN
jgi:Ca-activated chloride channel family protein